MGFRISLYCVPKEIVHKYENFTEDDYRADKDGIMFDELEKERIKYDTLTDVIMRGCEGKFSSRLFKNELAIEDDIYFGTISKEQFLNIIEEVRTNHILRWFDGRRVDKDKLGDVWLNPPMYLYKDEEWTAEDAMKANQGEWNLKADGWKYEWLYDEKKHFLNINIDMDNKWIVSGANIYEYVIFDLIDILKIFDWENNVLVCIGG
jgi:hypothetical protein